MAPSLGQAMQKIFRLKIVKSKLRVSTWNVRTLFVVGKLANAIKEIRRMKIKLMGMNELRWPRVGVCFQEGRTLHYSGSAEND